MLRSQSRRSRIARQLVMEFVRNMNTAVGIAKCCVTHHRIGRDAAVVAKGDTQWVGVVLRQRQHRCNQRCVFGAGALRKRRQRRRLHRTDGSRQAERVRRDEPAPQPYAHATLGILGPSAVSIMTVGNSTP